MIKSSYGNRMEDKPMSRYSEASKEYTMKYQKEKLDQIAIRVPKGKREEYKAKAEAHGKSLARYICDLIENDP